MQRITEQQEIERYLFLIKRGYKVNEKGQVTSPRGVILSATKNGYIYSQLKIGNVFINIYMHRFVYWYFNNKVADLTVNHINGIRFDNRPENLENISANLNLSKEKRIKKVFDGIIETVNGDFKVYQYQNVIFTGKSYNECIQFKMHKNQADLLRYQEHKDVIEKLKTTRDIDNFWLETTKNND